ncbi:unnamed protein product [Prunus armeniaca]|uniref:Uncharacterized protein n=1 Tax=Prunus armeniaca TaxID=36596 RepID=A0A6J5XIH6_PRUAR|nr:unnamed protein product [Prunus armeniaca]
MDVRCRRWRCDADDRDVMPTRFLLRQRWRCDIDEVCAITGGCSGSNQWWLLLGSNGLSEEEELRWGCVFNEDEMRCERVVSCFESNLVRLGIH